ncbi:serine/arginine-rich SC35-like splicing factor SCL28 isoform X1 [Phragmites australis]|uniref:serine/arginine-rich SC35-like splicing factor SCL28 isoform X1 n=1 Tax=Phragmites australis TaxID=29695 RepID=UPI002D777C3B|nr:serine/arginine-rich SC35-like splicing factor SCL28 isoform X1 [Phragmites australis]XP_062211355.1 serine/arginine-rich SC35-like splicing factor SCL28 isoform X1 [Phragmites australis]
MAGYHSRSRSRSYSPQHRRYSRSPPRRKRYDDPRDRYRGSGGGRFGARRGYGRPAAPSGLLVRNISLTARPEDLRVPFEQFGPVKDIYLPRNFHTRELRGFGFVKFRYPEDAAVAKQEMNHKVIGGREISIVYAEENRKTPQEMSTRTRTSGRYMDGSYTRPSLSRSPRSRYHSYSPSPSPVRRDFRGRDCRDNYSPGESYSPHPRDKRYYMSNSRSLSLDGPDRQLSPSNSRHGRPTSEWKEPI